MPSGPLINNTGLVLHPAKRAPFIMGLSMKTYTRKGDDGKTSMLCAGRVPKYVVRLEAMGTIDELNSWISYISSINQDDAVDKKLAWLQAKLSILCSDIAAPIEKMKRDKKIARVKPEWNKQLEVEIDKMQRDLPVLHNFIKIKRTPTAAALNLARTVCRRGERWLILLREEEGGVNAAAVRFVNRLSDYLFMLARWANYRLGESEPPLLNTHKDHCSPKESSLNEMV